MKNVTWKNENHVHCFHFVTQTTDNSHLTEGSDLTSLKSGEHILFFVFCSIYCKHIHTAAKAEIN